MKFSKIRLAYRMVIDNTSGIVWQQYVFEDTFREYLMQQQAYNSKENPQFTFRNLLYHNDKAEKLHFLTGIAAEPYIGQLKGNIYNVPDALGNNYLPFINYKLDIINTDIRDSTKHKIGITFYSPVVRLIDLIDRHYLVSVNTETVSAWETLSFPFQENLAICYFEKADY